MRDGFTQIDPESLALISRTPWSAALLANPAFTWVDTPARFPQSSGENALFAQTLRTPSAIRACASFYNFPTSFPSSSSSSSPPPSPSPAHPHGTIPETRMVLHLGSGLNVLPDICHGGLLALLCDEVMGLLMTFHEDAQTVTARLNITYRRPVPTPGLVLSRARLVKREKRKMWVEGEVEDGEGGIFASAEALFVELKASL